MKIEEQIIDLLSGELSPTETLELEKIISNDPNVKSLYDQYSTLYNDTEIAPHEHKKPSRRLKDNITKLLATEKQKIEKDKSKKGRITFLFFFKMRPR